MTDQEITRIAQEGRRQGFARACGIAFFAALVSGAAAAFLKHAVAAAMLVAFGVLVSLAVGAVLLECERDGNR